MSAKKCLTEKEILDSRGKIVNNSDGTISLYTINPTTKKLAPEVLTKPCCEKINGTFDVNTQKCRWAKPADCVGDYFNIVLNPTGNDGAIFSKNKDEIATITIDFDYLIKFNCSTLTDLANKKIVGNCNSVVDVFESINASIKLDIVKEQKNSIVLETAYQQILFDVIGTGNLYNYLLDKEGDSGFYVCGGLTNNKTDTTCHAINPYDLNITGDTINCSIFTTQILESLFVQSGLPLSEKNTTFKTKIREDSFASDWLNFSIEITDDAVLSAITNEKIKLTINVSGACIDTCILVDNIKLIKNVTKVTKNSLFVTESPGFELDKIIDNKKSWVSDIDETHREFNISRTNNTRPIRQTDYYIEDARQIINTKEIDLDINIASAVETDVWAYISDNPCILTGTSMSTTSCVKYISTGSSVCIPKVYCCSEYFGDSNIDINSLLTQPLSGVTTIEDFKYFIKSELIDAKNRKTISGYPTLRLLYDRYLNSTNFCGTVSSKFGYLTMTQFANLIGNYWVDLIEQVIPATTIWGSTRIYTNTIFDSQKYKYRGYTTFFGDNTFNTLKAPSSTTGYSCDASATTTVIKGATTTNAANYSKMYTVQMNSGSEFFGSVRIMGITNNNSAFNNITVLNEKFN